MRFYIYLFIYLYTMYVQHIFSYKMRHETKFIIIERLFDMIGDNKK